MLIDTDDPETLAMLNEHERAFLAHLAARLADIEAARAAAPRPLRELRKERGLTCKALADLAGVSEGAVHRYETRRRQPEHGPLRALARALGVPVKAIALEVYVPPRRTREGAAPVAVIGDTVVELTETQAVVLAALLDAGEAGIPGGPRGQVIRLANALGLVVQTVMGEPGERLRYRLVGPGVRLV